MKWYKEKAFVLAGFWIFVAVVVCGALSSFACAAAPLPQQATTEAEQLLFKSVDSIRHHNSDQALKYLDELVLKYPNYRLAHLIRGDLLMSKVRPISGLGAGRFSDERVRDLREEAVARLMRLNQHVPTHSVPWLIWSLPSLVKYVFVVEADRSRLYVLKHENGLISYVTDFYVSIGRLGSGKNKEGDQKTPLGVYTITSQLAKNQLKDLYGSGALPLSYPNDWDMALGRTGYGIWLHGVPSDTFSRAPKASDGCVVLANPDFELLRQYAEVGRTPVVIASKLVWLHPSVLTQERNVLLSRIEAFRQAWESKNVETYLSFYSSRFQAQGGMNYTQWVEQKRVASERKSWKKVRFSNIEIFLYPGYDRLAQVTFDQDYQSSEFSHKMRKRQYWSYQKGRWHIVYEGTV